MLWRPPPDLAGEHVPLHSTSGAWGMRCALQTPMLYGALCRWSSITSCAARERDDCRHIGLASSGVCVCICTVRMRCGSVLSALIALPTGCLWQLAEPA